LSDVPKDRPTLLQSAVAELRDFPFTISLIVVYVALFVLMAVGQGGLRIGGGPLTMFGLSIDTLVDFGAIESRQIVQNDQWWRLITATFLHGSVLHLVLNVMAVYQLGRIIEDWYGGSPVLVLHVILGLAGSLFSLWLHRMMPGRLVQVGGSGAIFGFAAFLLMGSYFDKHEESPKLFRSLAFFIVIGFVLGYFIGADNAAHAGGALAGAILGTFDDLIQRDRLSRVTRRTLGVASIGIFLTCFAFGASAYAQQLDQRHEQAIEQEGKNRRDAEQRYLVRASFQISSIRAYAHNALKLPKPPDLLERDRYADVLEEAADHISERETADYLRSVAELLRVKDADVFTSREHLQKLMTTLSQGLKRRTPPP
jgi:rhomboid protease GluP